MEQVVIIAVGLLIVTNVATYYLSANRGYYLCQCEAVRNFAAKWQADKQGGPIFVWLMTSEERKGVP